MTNETNKGLENLTRAERIAFEESVTPQTIEQRIKALELVSADSGAGFKSVWDAITQLRKNVAETVNKLQKDVAELHQKGG